ncbi:MAG: hypothetical protein J2P15_01995 [Micromonosporaceae bacterium]|nr:hypothetical protein [Micromonosporaceae bacterium]
MAAALPAGAAVSQQSPSVAVVQIGSPAVLDARGAAVNVPLSFVCSPGANAFVFVFLNERVGNDIASGGSDELSLGGCTGSSQSASVTVLANGNAFRQGVAVGSAQLVVFNDVGELVGTDQRNVEVAKK